MPRLSRRLSSSARKAALALRTRVNSLNLTGIRSGTLGRTWSWRSNANSNSSASGSATMPHPSSSTSADVTSDTATLDRHVRNASVPLDHHADAIEDDELRQHTRWASAPTELSSGSTTRVDHLGGGGSDYFGASGTHQLNGDGDGDDSATVVDLAHDADAQTLTPPPHPTRPAPRPPTPHQIVPPSAADDSALSPLDIDSNMFASFTTVVGGESSTASSAAALAAEPHHSHPNTHRRHYHTHHSHHSHYEICDPIPSPATTNVSISSLVLNPQARDSSSLLAPSLVAGDAAAQHMCVPSTLSSFSDPRQPDDTILHDPHRRLLSPSDFDATLESTMIPGLDLATVSPFAFNEDAISTASTVIRSYTPPPLAAASSSSAAASHYPDAAPPSGTHLHIATHPQLPSSPQPTVPRRRSLSASTLDRIPTFGRRSSSSGSTSSSSLAARARAHVPELNQAADRTSVLTACSSEGTVLAHDGRASPAGTLDTIRRAGAHGRQQRPDGVADYYESQLAQLAYEYHEELVRAQVEREALMAELARVRAQAAAAASDAGTPKPAAAADDRQPPHGRADTSDSDDVAANTTVSSLASDTGSARTAGTAGTASTKKKRVRFDSETLLAQLEASQLARQRADNTIRRLQEQLALVSGSAGAGQADGEAYFPVSAREFKMIRDSAADVEMLAHAVQARVRRFEADRGVAVGDESGSESDSETAEVGTQVKTRVEEDDKWERVVALVAHVVKGTEVIVREASAIFDWAASAGHPIASPEELQAWHADRGIVLRVMRAAQSVVDAAAVGAAKESPANVSEQQQENPAAAVVGGAVDVAAAKTVAIGACVQLAGWVQLIESAVGDITDSLRV